MNDFVNSKPCQNEDTYSFAKRLESSGADEIEIRKALRNSFNLTLNDAIEVTKNFEEARIRYVKGAGPNICGRNEQGRIYWLKRNLNATEKEAISMLNKYFPNREVQ